MQATAVHLLPYALDLAGGVCIAFPWFMDQRHKSHFGVGRNLKASNIPALMELGREMQRHGFSQFIGVDKTQQRVAAAGIGLLAISFLMRICVFATG